MNDNAGLEPVPVAAHDGLLAPFQTRPLFHRSGFQLSRQCRGYPRSSRRPSSRSYVRSS